MPLQYDTAYWLQKLGPDIWKLSLQERLQLILSLVIFLQVSLANILEFIFTTEIEEVRSRASQFMGYTPSADDNDKKFPPGMIFWAWYKNFPKAKKFLREMIQPIALEMSEEESDKIITDGELKVKMKTLTLKGIQDLMQPQRIMEKYQKHAPFTWSILYKFAASPNKWRKETVKGSASGEDADDQDWEDDPNLDDDKPEKTWRVPSMPEGFSRNPVLVRFWLFMQET